MSADSSVTVPHELESVIAVPYGEDLLKVLARLILQRYATALPNLNRCIVLLPDLLFAPRLRANLAEQSKPYGVGALLGPAILTMRQWAVRYGSPQPILATQAQELMLVDSLKDYRGLFGDGDPWLLARDLLELFAELTQQQVTMPHDLSDFTARLKLAYQCSVYGPSALGREATLVHTLWHAWHQQLVEEGHVDTEAAYISQLASSLSALASDKHIYLVGGPGLFAFERKWVYRLLKRKQVTVIFQGELPKQLYRTPHPSDALRPLLTDFGYTPTPHNADEYNNYLENVFPSDDADGLCYAERAHRFASIYITSPALDRLFIYRAIDPEAEARAVDIQVRRWLLEGRRRIGIVCEDRRLARRLRALLERANVPLADSAGWALSTTAAAAALQRWLEALEEDFAYQPLIDLLKSPFIFPDRLREEVLATVYRFEQDIVHHENIGRGLDRYRQHLTYRRARLSHAVGTAVQQLLDVLEQAAQPLLPLIQAKRPLSSMIYLRALNASLQQLGMLKAWQDDPAGVRILQELAAMQHALLEQQLLLDWRGFRTWLGRNLERYNFQPPTPWSPVQLLPLEHSTLAHCDALVIVGATRDYLPGASATSPFFNDAVRRELGLVTARDRYGARLYRFRRLLEAAPQILITTRLQEDGEDVLPSPWLELLSTFHQLAYGTSLTDKGLALLVDHPQAQIMRGDISPLPTVQLRPAPSVPASLLPNKISTGIYQELMNCPYQFYAARCLRLTAPEEIRDALQKSDYGERVHLILQAFHSGAIGHPGPYPHTLTQECRQAAIAFLERISHSVFAQDLEDNFLHRAWLQRWLQIIPQYVDWQIERAAIWQIEHTEVDAEVRRNQYMLRGRLDRVDRGADGLGIIDYKTGVFPREEEVFSGEAVQLPFYALLSDEHVRQVEYLSLDAKQVHSGFTLAEPQLSQLTTEVGNRLDELLQSLENGAPMPAWGDENTCQYCQMAGVCRRAVWIQGSEPNIE